MALIRELGKPMPRLPERSFVGGIVSGIGSIFRGLKVTLHYFVRPSTVVTGQYPENRATLKIPERVRSQLSFNFDDNGFHKCTACHICEQACPNASIRVSERKTPIVSKVELDTFLWRLDSCTFCNLCVMVCPFTVLKMGPTFESAVYDQRLLVYNLTPYAGPAAAALMKIADSEERKKALEPRDVFSGPTPLSGVPLAGMPRKKEVTS